MPRHYIYRIDHDENFAPNVDYKICTLCGCKDSTIEVWAEKGSWVIGIGGNGTGKPNKLIYAMKVEETLTYSQFRIRFSLKSKYLQGIARRKTKNVLFSRRFYYFGDKAIDLPHKLRHIIIPGRGCKRVSDSDTTKLANYLAREYRYGKHGNPNNGDSCARHTKC